MASTTSGHGYWLVARDGGIFSFGDAKFHGSTGSIRLNQPIVGIVRYPTGTGYTMVARDGGIFAFGVRRFFGSLPGSGVHVSDVVGMAQTGSGLGYWIVRSGGQVYAFGNAENLRPYVASPCDPVVAIIGNPTQQGFRLVMRSGATIARGVGVDGQFPIGTPIRCK
jgi:ribosomal protein L24E